MRATSMYGAGDVRIENVPEGRIDNVPNGYRAMNEREAIKVMIEF